MVPGLVYIQSTLQKLEILPRRSANSNPCNARKHIPHPREHNTMGYRLLAVRTNLSFLNKQEMHCCICNDDQSPRDHSKPGDIEPVGLGVEAKGTQDGCAGHLDVQAVLVIDQSQEGDLVDNEGLEAVVEYRQLDSRQYGTSSPCEANLHFATREPTWEWHRG